MFLFLLAIQSSRTSKNRSRDGFPEFRRDERWKIFFFSENQWAVKNNRACFVHLHIIHIFFLSGVLYHPIIVTGIIVSHYKDLYEPAQVSWRNAEFSGMGLLWKTNHGGPADVIPVLFLSYGVEREGFRMSISGCFKICLFTYQNFPHLYQSENLNSLIHRSTGISSREATRARSLVRCTVKAGGTGKNRRPTGWQSVTYDPKNLRNFNFVLWKVLYFFSPFFFGETAFMWKKTWVQLDFFAGLCGAGHLIVEASWTFPHEEVPPVPDAADLERMVKREEILHTGKLKLKIIKASDTVDGSEIR